MLEIDNLFYSPEGGNMGNRIMSKFKVANSDHLTKAFILKKFEESHNKKSFCKENHLNMKQLRKA